jgi:hypothetical protein
MFPVMLPDLTVTLTGADTASVPFCSSYALATTV